jgi:hypothetical protein
VQLEVDIAGEQLLQSFNTSANQSYTYTWDGNDGYGRPAQGQQAVLVRVGYVYQAQYVAPSENPLNTNPNYNAEFGHFTYFGAPASISGGQITLWYEWHGQLGALDAGPQGSGLGGWTLSANHVYDPASQTLYYGDGRTRTVLEFPRIGRCRVADVG